MTPQGRNQDTRIQKSNTGVATVDKIVLDKAIFNNVFEKDVRRVYIYKRAERLAKALQLVLPAFKDAKSLKERVGRLSVSLVDASVLPPKEAKEVLPRELLSLMSVLEVARVGGMLSSMNAEIISREAHNLLQEIAGYDEQKVVFEEVPTLATLFKATAEDRRTTPQHKAQTTPLAGVPFKGQPNGHTYKEQRGGRSESVISILKTKGPSSIKDISMLVREVSEKTIQRELQALVSQGRVKKEGERRWTTYTLLEDTKGE